MENKQNSEHKILKLRCYAAPRGLKYYAHCIDLNLGVLRANPEDAMRELELQIDSYLKVALESTHPEQLIPRRSPFNRQLEYYKALLIVTACKMLSFDCDMTTETEHIDYACPA